MTNNKHGGQGPGTSISNNRGQEIDDIWHSQGIIISQGGYPPFHDRPKSDHRLLWIKISYNNAFRENKASYRVTGANILILNHIRYKEKYTPNIILLTMKNNLLQYLRELEPAGIYPLSKIHRRIRKHRPSTDKIQTPCQLKNQKA